MFIYYVVIIYIMWKILNFPQPYLTFQEQLQSYVTLSRNFSEYDSNVSEKLVGEKFNFNQSSWWNFLENHWIEWSNDSRTYCTECPKNIPFEKSHFLTIKVLIWDTQYRGEWFCNKFSGKFNQIKVLCGSIVTKLIQCKLIFLVFIWSTPFQKIPFQHESHVYVCRFQCQTCNIQIISNDNFADNCPLTSKFWSHSQPDWSNNYNFAKFCFSSFVLSSFGQKKFSRGSINNWKSRKYWQHFRLKLWKIW